MITVVEKKMVTTLVEPEVYNKIEQERGHEPRSSFLRRIIVRWYNSLSTKEIDE